MPHFSKCCGSDEYICQICGSIKCSNCSPSVWRVDITENENAGNVCPKCLKNYSPRNKILKLMRQMGYEPKDPKKYIGKVYECKILQKIPYLFSSASISEGMKVKMIIEQSRDKSGFSCNIIFNNSLANVSWDEAPEYLQCLSVSKDSYTEFQQKFNDIWNKKNGISSLSRCSILY